MYERNCFITLTYNDAHLPAHGSLDLSEFQRFMKRLRKRFGAGIRFFHCGEYGERFQRPHYHACLFNFDFDDRRPWKNERGVTLDVSKALEELWSDQEGNPIGFTTVGDVTFESAAYVARYITKKITGERAEEHYSVIDYEDGEILGTRRPEYVTMSRRPGIGRPWLDKYMTDVYPSDEVVMRGKLMRPPKYYDNIFQLEDPKLFDSVRSERQVRGERFKEHNTFERLAVREEIQLRKFKLLKRGYEHGS